MTSSPSNDSVLQNAMAEIRAELELAKVQAQNLAQESLSANTQRLYESDWRGFLAWVQRAQVGNTELCAIPATYETLALYIGPHVDIKPSTLAGRLAAIRLMHRWSGYESLFEKASSLSAVYIGYKRRWAQRRPSKSPQSAATESIVQALVDDQSADTLIGLRDRALPLVGFDAALRRSELVGLDVRHIDAHVEGLELHLFCAKSDKNADGSAAYLQTRPGSIYCPVRAVLDWLGAANISEGAIFRQLHRCGKSLRLGVERLSDKTVYTLVKGTAAELGVPGRFDAHSVRRGLTTSALQTKQDIGTVQEHVLHKNISTTSCCNEQVTAFNAHPGKPLLI